MLKKIGSNARYEMERLLDTQVNLKLWVKVRKDWRDSELMMKNFGYNKKTISDTANFLPGNGGTIGEPNLRDGKRQRNGGYADGGSLERLFSIRKSD